MQKRPQVSFTKEGYDKLFLERDDLKIKRKDAVMHLKRAREMGDLSENGYYKSARAKLSFIDRRLNELSWLIRYGVIADQNHTENITIGSTVTVKSDNQEVLFHIVGQYEADPSVGKISDVSPLGKILLGKKAGDSVTLHAPAGERTYIILNVK
jgi:transcription elongation factor GreA